MTTSLYVTNKVEPKTAQLSEARARSLAESGIVSAIQLIPAFTVTSCGTKVNIGSISSVKKNVGLTKAEEFSHSSTAINSTVTLQSQSVSSTMGYVDKPTKGIESGNIGFELPLLSVQRTNHVISPQRSVAVAPAISSTQF